jgi:hypothetical protein
MKPWGGRGGRADAEDGAGPIRGFGEERRTVGTPHQELDARRGERAGVAENRMVEGDEGEEEMNRNRGGICLGER